MGDNDAPRTHAHEQVTPGQQWALIVLDDHGPLATGTNTTRPVPKAVTGLDWDLPGQVHQRVAAELIRFGLADQLPHGWVQITDAGRRLLEEVR